MKEDFFECRFWTTITLKVQLPLNAKVPFYSKPITSSVGSERLRSGCNLSSDQGETVYGLAEIFFIIRWLVAWGDGWLEIGTEHDHRFSIQDGGQVRFLQGDGQETSS